MINYKVSRRGILKTLIYFFLQSKVFSMQPTSSRKKTRIIFGSCSNQKKNMFHWKQIASHQPDYIFLLGDNVYGDFFNENALELIEAYKKLDANNSFKNLKNNVPIIPIWDDHDYGKNDGGKNWAYKNTAKELFLNFFNVPSSDIRRSREGIYKSSYIKTNKVKIKVIALDTRYFRDDFKHNYYKNINKKYLEDPDPKKSILGDKQWQWFIKELDDNYNLLIVLSSFQVLSNAHGWEKWGNFPLEREKIITSLASIKKPIIVLSGDRHFAGIYNSGHKNFIEVTSSSFNQNVFNYNEIDPLRKGKLITENNFGFIEVDNKEVIIKIISGSINNYKELASTNIKLA